MRKTSSRSPRIRTARAKTALPKKAVDFLAAHGREPGRFRPIAGDVGTRRYFRGPGADGATELLALYEPSDVGMLDRWIASHALLAPNVRLPAILAFDREVPAALHEDFGNTDLAASARSAGDAEDLFLRAGATAAALRKVAPPAAGEINTPLDATLVRFELDITRREFFAGLNDERWPNRQRVAFDEWVFRLAERMDALPRLTCHRDYHGNNLFPLADGSIGVIDFQDVRPGPLGYDLASLLFERSAVELVDTELADDVIRAYARQLGLGVTDLARAVHLCRLERGWKAIGTFARELRKKRIEYRNYLDLQIEAMVGLLESAGDGGTAIPDFVLRTLHENHRQRRSAKAGSRNRRVALGARR